LRTFNFYIDDSGTRHPDHSNGSNGARDDWFALGGVIVDEKEEAAVKAAIEGFKEKWNVVGPLHSNPIRRKEGDFEWMRDHPERSRKFLEELTQLLIEAPVVGHGCVIDRPEYNRRYMEQYGRSRWSLCRTTFTIAVERAAKFAISQGGRIKIFVEGSSKPDEAKLKQYYLELQNGGNPFDVGRSAIYNPLGRDTLSRALFEFRVKQKSSLIMQLADLYLYPICKGGYDKGYLPYKILCDNKKLIDQLLPHSEVGQLGIKYSCFESAAASQKVA
jgi:hypothetical protein